MTDAERNLINSVLVDAFVRAFEAYQDPGDSFRSCVRHALTEVAPAIVARALTQASMK